MRCSRLRVNLGTLAVISALAITLTGKVGAVPAPKSLSPQCTFAHSPAAGPAGMAHCNASSVSYASYPYGHTSSLNDVTTGSTSNCGSDLCAATTDWDGPTGLGTGGF